MSLLTVIMQACERAKTAVRAVSARAAALFKLLIQATSTDEDTRRKEYILNIILTISLSLFVILEITVIYNSIVLGKNYHGLSPFTFGGITLVYAFLLSISKKGYVKISSYITIGIYVVGALYAGWTWGASLPATLLITAMVIVTSSILINSRVGFIMTGIMICALGLIGYHEAIYLHIPFWRYDPVNTTDVITYAGAFLFMSFISWLSNREIKRSLDRARNSEKLLAEERNLLEKKVAERTYELERIAQFGSLSQGLFHDLMTPLTSISLHLEQVANKHQESKECQEMLQKTIAASKRMGGFMNSLKQTIRTEDTSTNKTDIAKKFILLHDLLGYKARMVNATIITNAPKDLVIFAHPIKIHQILMNLVSNSIDACAEKKNRQEHKITVSITSDQKNISILVEDTGCGIPPERIKDIFRRSFTTKNNGTGIGLATVKSIVEDELKGTIVVQSIKNEGTRFSINIPNNNAEV